jgi:hypothetical protein
LLSSEESTYLKETCTDNGVFFSIHRELLTLGLGEVAREEEHADPLTTPQPTSELTASQLIPNQLITSEQTANELSSSSSQLTTPELPDLTVLLAPVVQTLPRHDSVEVPSFAARGADIEVDGDESTPSYLGVQEDTRMGGSSPGVQVASVTTPLPSVQGTVPYIPIRIVARNWFLPTSLSSTV